MMTLMTLAMLLNSALLTGNEFAIAAFIHPSLSEQDHRANLSAIQRFAQLYGKVMPLWMGLKVQYYALLHCVIARTHFQCCPWSCFCGNHSPGYPRWFQVGISGSDWFTGRRCSLGCTWAGRRWLTPSARLFTASNWHFRCILSAGVSVGRLAGGNTNLKRPICSRLLIAKR